jgi:hypothetical protein
MILNRVSTNLIRRELNNRDRRKSVMTRKQNSLLKQLRAVERRLSVIQNGVRSRATK